MSYKIKSVVLFLKFLSNLLLLRNFGNIIYDLSAKYEDALSTTHLRKLEKLSKKVRKAELDVQFLKNCLIFNVFPKFVSFPLPGTEIQDVKAIRKRLLRSSIKKREKEYRKLVFERDKLHSEIKAVVTTVEMYVLSKAIQRNLKKKEREWIQTHEKKLKNMTKNEILPFTASDTINNLSSYRLTSEEEEVLKHGLTHSIVPPKIRKSDIYTSFEMLHRCMHDKLANSQYAPKLKSDLSHLAHLCVSSHRVSAGDMRGHIVLKRLHKNEGIVILRADRGNSVVIVDRDDYMNGIMDVINDGSKFRKLSAGPTLTGGGELQRFLGDLENGGGVDGEVYGKICPMGSQPARICGLPKIHKQRAANAVPAFRPIVSSVRTYNCQLSKFLCSMLSPYIPREYTTTDTFSFVSELKSVDANSGFMVSFDVGGLFAGVPLTGSIGLAVSCVGRSGPGLGLSGGGLAKLFSFATAQARFLFGGAACGRMDGVSVGSPLAPVLASLFMGHHENIWLRNYSRSKLSFCRGYVGDAFCLFGSGRDALSFFGFVGGRHPGVAFSVEGEVSSGLAFLGVLVDGASSSSPVASVCHGASCAGLLANFFSFSPHSYKVGLVKTLVDRAYKINNTWHGFHKDIESLVITLGKNFFPAGIIDPIIKHYLDKASAIPADPGKLNTGPSGSIIHFKLPYLNASAFAQGGLRSLLGGCCAGLRIGLAFSSCRVSNMFSIKDPIPISLRSLVVYKFSCAGCSSVYVGETCRHFSTRVREHLARDKNSHIYKHLTSSKTCKKTVSNESCFTILDTAKCSYELKIKEALHIGWLKPTLNSQLSHANLTLDL